MNEIPRRAFLLSAGTMGLAAGVSELLAAQAREATNAQEADLLLHEREGEVRLIGDRRGRVVIKVDRSRLGVETMSLLIEDIVPDDGVPVHKHGAEEEFIYIARGRGVMTLGDEEVEVGPGAMALVPRGVWHGLRNESDDSLRMFFGYSPAGFEDYFRAIGVRPGEPSQNLTGEDWARINREFRITYR